MLKLRMVNLHRRSGLTVATFQAHPTVSPLPLLVRAILAPCTCPQLLLPHCLLLQALASLLLAPRCQLQYPPISNLLAIATSQLQVTSFPLTMSSWQTAPDSYIAAPCPPFSPLSLGLHSSVTSQSLPPASTSRPVAAVRHRFAPPRRCQGWMQRVKLPTTAQAQAALNRHWYQGLGGPPTALTKPRNQKTWTLMRSGAQREVQAALDRHGRQGLGGALTAVMN
mmetsp:Transcript_37961/g.85610  ORF Transcript_37961/g.85610 Transcript_37961/m.85610 type:complete len:224 (-) Transcript_37961:21-692(-)